MRRRDRETERERGVRRIEGRRITTRTINEDFRVHQKQRGIIRTEQAATRVTCVVFTF